jgi:hypothetical protein
VWCSSQRALETLDDFDSDFLFQDWMREQERPVAKNESGQKTSQKVTEEIQREIVAIHARIAKMRESK